MSKENIKTTDIPKMMTIREVAKTGILSEYAIRKMVREGKCLHIMVGTKALINFDKLVEMLNGE